MIEYFQGRINKFMDSCYSFWVGGTLQALGYDHLINLDDLREFILVCQASVVNLNKLLC